MRVTGGDEHRGRHRARFRAVEPSPAWRPVAGFEGYYEVAEDGRVRRVRPGKGAVAGKVVGAHANGGRPRVALTRAGATTWRFAEDVVRAAWPREDVS